MARLISSSVGVLRCRKVFLNFGDGVKREGGGEDVVRLFKYED